MSKLSPKTLYIAGLSLLLIPLGFLILFALGELLIGDWGGIGHLSQLLPLVAVCYISWKRPFIGGFILIVVGSILATFYALNTTFPLLAIATTELIIFLPPILSGILLMMSEGE